MRRVTLVTIAVVVLTLVVPISGIAATPANRDVTVKAGTPDEFKFTLPKTIRVATTITFKVHNHGTIPHDFKITKKGTPPLAPAKTATLKVKALKPGKYPYLCTLPGHAQAGMKGVLTVTK